MDDDLKKCPVCKADTQDAERGFFDGYAVKCPTHGWVEVSDTVRVTRANEPRAAWEKALAKARARRLKEHDTIAGKRPQISDDDFL